MVGVSWPGPSECILISDSPAISRSADANCAAPTVETTNRVTLPMPTGRSSYRESEWHPPTGRHTLTLNSTLLPAMGGLYNALTATTWLLAMYTVITAFFHFYLFFALSIPFSHLVDETAPLPRDKSHPGDPDEKDEFELKRMGKDAVQVEVDIRAKCERPPFESYIWVWWAWWGHRRSPVGAIFSLVQGVMALSSVGHASRSLRSC